MWNSGSSFHDRDRLRISFSSPEDIRAERTIDTFITGAKPETKRNTKIIIGLLLNTVKYNK